MNEPNLIRIITGKIVRKEEFDDGWLNPDHTIVTPDGTVLMWCGPCAEFHVVGEIPKRAVPAEGEEKGE